ncbi:hypothetical protein XH97_29550 [Bradyrhizobium sp. CCBAU 53380]|nr:hypothetical protein [Bradyrhizobium sp. CCBAU 53380]
MRLGQIRRGGGIFREDVQGDANKCFRCTINQDSHDIGHECVGLGYNRLSRPSHGAQEGIMNIVVRHFIARDRARGMVAVP